MPTRLGLPRCSGTTTPARVLAPLLPAPEGPPAELLSTDVIRAELFGDAAVQGPWIDTEARMHQRLLESVAAGR